MLKYSKGGHDVRRLENAAGANFERWCCICGVFIISEGVARVAHMSDIETVVARVERVVMLTLVQLLLFYLTQSLSITWIVVFSAMISVGMLLLLQLTRPYSSVWYLINVARRVSVYVVVHGSMRATTPPEYSAVLVLVYGTATLSALAVLTSHAHLPDGDAERLVSQIVYAYAIAVQGTLAALRNNRTFGLVAFALMSCGTALRNALESRVLVADIMLQALDLVAFESYTTAFFTDSGDSFNDIGLVVFSYVLLSTMQQQLQGMQSTKQYVVWRIAARLLSELRELDASLALVLGASVLLLACIKLFFPPRFFPWLPPLVFLVAVNAATGLLQAYLDTMGLLDTLPVLLSIAVVTGFVTQQLARS